MGPLLALLLTFGLMWVLLILPQQRKMRQHQTVVASLQAGDEVVTAGGVYGTIMSVDEETLAVEVAPGVVLRVLRSAVSQRIAPFEDVDDEDDDDMDDDDTYDNGTDGASDTDGSDTTAGGVAGGDVLTAEVPEKDDH
jgi:preprotein translocase subunit YajC